MGLRERRSFDAMVRSRSVYPATWKMDGKLAQTIIHFLRLKIFSCACAREQIVLRARLGSTVNSAAFPATRRVDRAGCDCAAHRATRARGRRERCPLPARAVVLARPAAVPARPFRTVPG